MKNDIEAVKRLIQDARTCLEQANSEVVLRKVPSGAVLVGAVGMLISGLDFALVLLDTAGRAE